MLNLSPIRRSLKVVLICSLFDAGSVSGQSSGLFESWPGENQAKAEANEYIRLNNLPQNTFDEYLLFRRNEALQLYDRSPTIEPAFTAEPFRKNEGILYDTTHYPLGSCNNLDFETGNFTGWSPLSGCNPANNSILTCTPHQSCCPVTGIKPARHTLTTLGMNNDPVCGFPMVAPGGSFSARIGQESGGGQADRLEQTFLVTQQNSAFIYQYAVVLQDPGHSFGKNPKFEAAFFDQSGDTVPCSYYMIEANSYIPGGFYEVPYDSANPYTMYGRVLFRPWTYVVVDLSNYVGQNVTARFTTMDCGEGLHYGYAYIDCACGPWAIQAGDSLFCEGDSINTTLTAPSGAYYYLWNTGDTTQTITVHATGTYSVEIGMVVDSTCKGLLTFDLNGFPKPDPGFLATTVCLGDPTLFTDTSAIDTGYIATHIWNFGDGSLPSSQQNPSHTYTAAGTYTVTLILFSDKGCSDTISKTVVVSPPVFPAFTAGMVCLGDPTLFTDQSTGAISSYHWDFGDGDTASVPSPVHVFTSAGTHSVTLTVTSANGCTRSVTVAVIVNESIADFTATTVCRNDQTQFTDGSTTSAGNIISWSWNFGNGNTSQLQNPAATYTASGTYTTTLVVTNTFGCKDTDTATVTVNPQPVANFSGTSVCFNSGANSFTDLSQGNNTITAWAWDLGDGTVITGTPNPAHSFTASGTYTVTLAVTNNFGCKDTHSTRVTIYPLPVANFSATNVCLNASTHFTDASVSGSPSTDPISSWNWNFGDGSNPSSQQNPVHSYSASGSYTASLTVTTQNGCRDTVTVPLTVYDPPAANFAAPKEGCSPVINAYQDLSTSASGNVSSWQWSFPGGSPSSSTLQYPQGITYATPGSYSVTLVVTTSQGCTGNITLPMVQVYPWPDAQFCVSPQQAPATNPVFSFCDQWSSDVVQWAWDFGDGSSLDHTSTDPVHIYNGDAAGNDFSSFLVCLNAENQYGCWDTVCHAVELIPEYEFYMPNSFTPNQDHVNDQFFGKCRGVKEYSIWIFDRWGNLLWDCYKEDHNTNWDKPGEDGLASACKWDGKVEAEQIGVGGGSDQQVQEDVYVWKVRLVDVFNRTHEYVGQVTVVK